MNQKENDELLLKKIEMLQRLGTLANLGVKLSQNYNLDSDYEEMKYEYELAKSVREKENQKKYLDKFMLLGYCALELINEKYDPFNVKLKGWTKVEDKQFKNEEIDDKEINDEEIRDEEINSNDIKICIEI